VVRIHYTADPQRDSEWAQGERQKYSSQAAWDREQEIVHEAGGGELLFAEMRSRRTPIRTSRWKTRQCGSACGYRLQRPKKNFKFDRFAHSHGGLPGVAANSDGGDTGEIRGMAGMTHFPGL